MPGNLENSAVATGLEKVIFLSNPKERQCQRMFKLPHNCTHLTSKIMLKILQMRLQHYMNWELTDVQAGFKKGKVPEINCQYPLDHSKKQEFHKNIYFRFIDYGKAFDYVNHNKLWKILKEMGIPHHLSCLLRNLYTGQEATVRARNETMYWFQTDKGVSQGCILSPCLFNLNAEYIIQNAGLDEDQAGIMIPGRSINNLRYADGTTLTGLPLWLSW